MHAVGLLRRTAPSVARRGGVVRRGRVTVTNSTRPPPLEEPSGACRALLHHSPDRPCGPFPRRTARVPRHSRMPHGSPRADTLQAVGAVLQVQPCTCPAASQRLDRSPVLGHPEMNALHGVPERIRRPAELADARDRLRRRAAGRQDRDCFKADEACGACRVLAPVVVGDQALAGVGHGSERVQRPAGLLVVLGHPKDTGRRSDAEGQSGGELTPSNILAATSSQAHGSCGTQGAIPPRAGPRPRRVGAGVTAVSPFTTGSGANPGYGHYGQKCAPSERAREIGAPTCLRPRRACGPSGDARGVHHLRGPPPGRVRSAVASKPRRS
ncbi:hypothetical protein C9F11_26120 [Streptomyces sp. YIM 121038]|nr:hypothetical protein C9F11_26120 [Streptomyces sp. YIM 121038]